jgi:transposase
MFFVGLDVHQKRSSFCILDQNGKKVKEFDVLGGWDILIEEIARVPRPFAICFEASTGCGWLFDRIAPLAGRIEVAHPGQVRLIFRAKKKNDRIDARKLATLLFLNQVPKAYIPDAQVRAWRGLVEFRHATIVKRTQVKNNIRTLLKGCGIQKIAAPAKTAENPQTPRKGSACASGQRGLWAKKGLAVLRELELPTLEDRLRRDMLLEQLDQFNGQVKRIEKELDKIAADHAGVSLLRTIPGVGARTAEAVLAYVDKPHRFERNKQIGAYFGLVPCQDASADVNRLGHITRQGPSTVRGLMVEAAWQAKLRSPTIKAFYEQVQQGKKERGKIALVATAHHLLRVMLSMLKSGEVWHEEGEIQKAPPVEASVQTALAVA